MKRSTSSVHTAAAVVEMSTLAEIARTHTFFFFCFNHTKTLKSVRSHNYVPSALTFKSMTIQFKHQNVKGNHFKACGYFSKEGWVGFIFVILNISMTFPFWSPPRLSWQTQSHYLNPWVIQKRYKGAAFVYRFTLEVMFSLLHSYLFFTVMTRMKCHSRHLPSQQKNQTRSSFDLILNHTRLSLSWMFLKILACLGMQILNTRKWWASAWIKWRLGFIFILT